MAMYKFYFYNKGGLESGANSEWWDKFVIRNALYYWDDVNKLLKEYHGTAPKDNFYNEGYLTFETEEDMLAFTIKYVHE
jgi:hypothetical protein